MTADTSEEAPRCAKLQGLMVLDPSLMTRLLPKPLN
jgi:hypothetical protein